MTIGVEDAQLDGEYVADFLEGSWGRAIRHPWRQRAPFSFATEEAIRYEPGDRLPPAGRRWCLR